MADDETARALFQAFPPSELPFGLYLLSPDGRLLECSDPVRRILGLSPDDRLDGKLIDFCHDATSRERFSQHLARAEGGDAFVESDILTFDAGGRQVHARSSCRALRDRVSGQTVGYVGCMMPTPDADACLHDLADQVWREVPVGIYVVRTEGEHDVIHACNPHFASIFGVGSSDELVGRSVRSLYAYPADYDLFLQHLKAADQQQRPLVGHVESFKTFKGRTIALEVSCRNTTGPDGRVVGRVGVVRAVGDEGLMHQEMRIWGQDLGQVLHSYQHTLVMVQQTLSSVLDSMVSDPFDAQKVPSVEEVDVALATRASSLAGALRRLLQVIAGDWTQRGIVQQEWETLTDLLSQLQNYRENVPVMEFRPPTLRLIAKKAAHLATALRGRRVPGEPVRQVMQEAQELQRVVSWATLRRAKGEVIAMEQQVRSLREYMTGGFRPKEVVRAVRISALVKQAMDNLQEFARETGVTFRLKDEAPNAMVMVVERDIVQALFNILHNAIKYSWRREKGEPPWVSIRIWVDGQAVHMEFENFGVPIPKEEIETRLIFRFGYRGVLSSDRGRPGSGLGLTQALNAAQKCGGDVAVSSTPAFRGADPKDYTQPFLTRVTMTLPRCGPATDSETEGG